LGHYVYHRELLPRKVNGPWEGKISHIATRGAHTAAITDSGELYNWGCDEGDRRLGLGSRGGPGAAGSLSVPSKVNALPVPVAAVACGGFFTMALTPELIILSCCFSHHGTWKLVMHLSYIILIGVTMI
jgi:alpha-tubulin suppressor-like RCC1 family protein